MSSPVKIINEAIGTRFTVIANIDLTALTGTVFADITTVAVGRLRLVDCAVQNGGGAIGTAGVGAVYTTCDYGKFVWNLDLTDWPGFLVSQSTVRPVLADGKKVQFKVATTPAAGQIEVAMTFERIDAFATIAAADVA